MVCGEVRSLPDREGGRAVLMNGGMGWGRSSTHRKSEDNSALVFVLNTYIYTLSRIYVYVDIRMSVYMHAYVRVDIRV